MIHKKDKNGFVQYDSKKCLLTVRTSKKTQSFSCTPEKFIEIIDDKQYEGGWDLYTELPGPMKVLYEEKEDK